MNTFGSRLKEILQQLHLSQKQLADFCETQPALISKYILNKVSPNIDFLIKLLKLNPTININYLLIGHGKPFLVDTPESYTFTGNNNVAKMTGEHAIANQYANQLALQDEFKKIEELAKLGKGLENLKYKLNSLKEDLKKDV